MSQNVDQAEEPGTALMSSLSPSNYQSSSVEHLSAFTAPAGIALGFWIAVILLQIAISETLGLTPQKIMSSIYHKWQASVSFL